MMAGLSVQWQRERAAVGLTLGGLIDLLDTLDPEALVTGLGELHSYRGFYEDLAFEPSTRFVTVHELLLECRSAMGQVFHGYKGGDFMMGALTPLWVATWGVTGERLMALHPHQAAHTTDVYYAPVTAPEPE